MDIVKRCSVAVSAVLLGGGVYAAEDAHSHAPAPAAHAAPAAPATSPSAAAPTPNDALRLLIEGNERYVGDAAGHPNAAAARRCETFTGGQHPIASILSCADSRVPPEILFDQGIGDLFVIRVAGNVSDTDEVASLEYGIEHLHTPLVVVMGHTKCGAVTAVVQEAHVSKNIEKLVDNIVPAVATARQMLPGAKGETLINASIDTNVMQSIQDLFARSEDARTLVAAGKVKVVGAVYDIHTGSIRWLGEHPRQAQLLKASADSLAAPGHDHETKAEPKPEAHSSTHAEQEHSSAAGEPAAAAEASAAPRPLAPHQSGTLKGMLLPAAFLGGAGLASGAIFKFLFSSPAPAAKPTADEA
jgi:carbonic anhydrase